MSYVTSTAHKLTPKEHISQKHALNKNDLYGHAAPPVCLPAGPGAPCNPECTDQVTAAGALFA
jgi:hypothetical protein